MKLRKLKREDAQRMLEWMHNEDVCRYMKADFASKTLDDCLRFIEAAASDENNIHLAVVNDDDLYMGTVSLKEVDRENKEAEFAITMHYESMGKGYAAYGMHEMIRLGLEEYGLDRIFWCVSKNNLRANRFYDKNGYRKITVLPEKYKKRYLEWESMNWYLVTILTRKQGEQE